MHPSKALQRFQVGLLPLALSLEAACIVVEWVWKPLFLKGWAAGVYWLFVLFDKMALPILGFAIVIALVLWLMPAIRKASHRQASIAMAVLLASSLLWCLTFTLLIATEITPVDSLQMQNKTYYLAAYHNLIDRNYALYECDSIGLFCEVIYGSPDADPSVSIDRVTLTYDPAISEFSINVSSKVVFIYASQE